jgi:hypothetical protein
MSVAYTITYNNKAIIKGARVFILQGPSVNIIRLFSSSLAIKSQMRQTILPGLTRKYRTRLERLTTEKRSSLFQRNEEKFVKQ